MQEPQYDYDEDLQIAALPVRAEVQQQATPSSKFSAPSFLPLPLQRLKSLASIMSLRGVVVGGGFVGAMVLYVLQYQKPLPPTPVANPYDVRNIPSYSEAPLMQEDLKAVSSQDLNMMALLTDEAQREIIAIAQGFTAQAVRFSQLPGHKCNGLTPLECLNTFDTNRITELQGLATAGAGKDNDILKPVLVRSQARIKVEGLLLAKIMATPPQSRRPSQQQIIDMKFPVLNAGLPANQLAPRPGTLAKNLQYTTQLMEQLEEKSPEQQSVAEFCATLTSEQRVTFKGCK